MANAIDLVASKEAISGLKELRSELQGTHELIIKISKQQLDFFGGSSPKNPAQMQKVISEFQKIETASNKATAQLVKNKERERLAEIKLSQDREKAFAKYEAQLNREQQKLAAAQNLYNKTQQQLNLVQQAYNNLALKKERYNNLTANEEKRLQTLQRVTEKYNSTLKAVDATVGKHTRNVGNYASAFNPLSNSINQLTREAPAFANSIQTGFMAISNNLPIFFDAMSQIIAQNKELQAQGKQTQSVLKQVAGAIFSWGTALSIGVTLLTVFGKEIVNFISNMGGATKAVDLNKQALERSIEVTEEYNTKASEMAANEISHAEKLLQTARNRNVSDAERKKAVDDLQSRYPAYLGNLKDEEILTGNITEAQNELLHALKLRAFAMAAQEMITENLRKQIKAEIESSDIVNKTTESQKLYDVQQQKNINTKKNLRLATDEELNSLENLEAAQKNSTKTTIINGKAVNQQLLNSQNKRINALIPLKREEEVLDAVFKKYMKYLGVVVETGKERVKQQKDLNLADVPASEFALMQAILNAEISNNQKAYENDRKTNEERAEAFSMLMLRRKQLATLEMEEEIRLENKATKVLLAQKGLSEKQRADIVEQNNINIQKIEFDHAQQILNIIADTTGKIEELYNRVAHQKRINVIDQEELDNIRQLNMLLANLSIESDLSRYKNAEKIKLELSKSANEKRIENELRRINSEIEGFDLSKENIEKLEILQNQRIAKEKELAVATNQRLEAEAEKMKQLIENTKAYFKTLQSGFLDKSGLGSLNFFMQLDKDGKSTFNKLIDGAQTMGQKMAIVFNGMAEVAQETFAFLNQQSEMRYQAEVSRLTNQRDIAIQFAGESSTAREEIERQYEERRRALERRKAEQARKIAIFNIIIDTAQAVVGALAEQNYGGALLFAALGAAQLSMVSSAQIPAYAEGTDNHPGGAMLINDGKGSNYEETVVTPDGKAKKYKGRNVLTSAPKGTKVYTNDQWQDYLNGILSGNDILHSRSFPNTETAREGLTKSDLDSGIDKLAKVIQNRESLTIVRDAKGERLYQKRQGMLNQVLNNRLKIKGYDI